MRSAAWPGFHPPDFVEYGTAIFNPGEVEVPLLLPADLVNELQSLDLNHDDMSAIPSARSTWRATPSPHGSSAS